MCLRHIGTAASFVPESFDAAESECHILYEWSKGLPAQADCPASADSIEILKVCASGSDVSELLEDADVAAMWMEACWDAHAAWLEKVEAEMAEAGLARRSRRRERRVG